MVAGNATLDNGSHLTLTGNATTIIILNIAGTLTVGSQAYIVLKGVLPEHVFWNLGGDLSVGSGAGFWGVALLAKKTQATLTGYQFGHCAVLSSGAILLADISASVGHNKFFAPARAAATCTPVPGYPGQACTYTRPNSELLLDGSLELQSCCPIYGSGLDAPSTACFWQSATAGSADYYHSCANNNPYTGGSIGVPYSYMTQYVTPGASGNKPVYALGQNTQAATGNAYAGCYAYFNSSSAPNSQREYLYQQVAGTVEANRRYYAEFSAHLAPMSDCAVPALGMLVGPATLPYPLASSSQVIALPPTLSGSPGGLPAPTSRNWQRIGGVFTSKTDLVNPKVIIGNFGSDAQAITPSGGGSFAYYFIDNATLSPLTEAGPNVVLNTSCASGPNTASVTLGTEPMPALVGATYAWTSSDGSLISTAVHPTVTPTRTTTYFLTVTINNQTYTSQATVTVYGGYGQNPGATYVSSGSNPYDIGDYGTVTTLDAGGGTMVFDGQYHVLGTTHFVNGKFELRPGTVFFIEGPSGLPYSSDMDTDHITLVLQQAGELRLSGATLQGACGSEPWQGVWLDEQGILRTAATASGLRSLIRDAATGVSSRAENQYYLADTDFRNNNVGVWDLAANKAAKPGEGIANCTFYGGLYGVIIEGSDYDNGVVTGGDYNAALYIGNTFADIIWFGLHVSAGKGHFVRNSFRNCGWAAMASGATPILGPAEFVNNDILVPGSNSYHPTAGPMGIYANDPTTQLTGNKIEGLPLSAGAAPRTGIFYQGSMSTAGPDQVTGNTVRNLEEGLATLTDDYNGSTITVTKNTFTNNAADLVLYPFGTQPFGATVTATIRCNSFINDASSTVANPIGIWLKNMAIITTGLNNSLANGNEFPTYWTNGTSLVNSNISSGNRLDYKRFASSSNENVSLSGPGPGQVFSDISSPLNACGGTAPGVNSRQYQYAVLPLSAAALTAKLDSLSRGGLSIVQQDQVLKRIRLQPAQAAHIPLLEARLLVPGALAPLGRLAIGLQLLEYYRTQRDASNTSRLRAWLRQQAPADVELQAYLNLIQATDQMGNFLPGLRPLAAVNRTLLSQAATSGTTSARPACYLLRAYDPQCACVLPSEPATTNRVGASVARAALATRVATSTPLAAYPNPAGTTLHVPYALPPTTGAAELLAYDALGRVVLRQALNGQQGEAEVSVQSWPAGLYHLVLAVDGQVQQQQRIAVSH